MKRMTLRWGRAGVPALLVAMATAATGVPGQAWALSGSWMPSDLTLGGFLRVETAVNTNGRPNENNQYGNPYNDFSGTLPGLTFPGGVPTFAPVTARNRGVVGGTGPSSLQSEQPLFNLHILRGELTGAWRFSDNLKLRGRLIGIADTGDYSDFNWAPYKLGYGDPALYGSRPNYFQYSVTSDGKSFSHDALPLEWDSPNSEVYFPSLFLEYAQGPIDVRLGEQQIAWGNAIFFRVFDTANGLDLRRHSLFDYAQEEYQDKRVPAPALRVTWQVNQAINVDAYVEKFQPTIFPNPETPYNAIPDQFTVYDFYKNYEDRVNWAIRLQWQGNQWSAEAMAGQRYNPWGVFRWTNAGIAGNPLPAELQANSTGVQEGHEWFHYAGLVRLNGTAGTSTAFAFPGDASAFPLTSEQAFEALNAGQNAANGLRGFIGRDYFQEYNFGAGVGYTTNAAPSSFWDQILIHLEVRYTPDRTLTQEALQQGYFRTNDWVGALTLEKYYRFSSAFPATYFVLQYMHRTRDDLFGRALAGYGASDYVPVDPAAGNYAPVTDPQPKGLPGGANYVVFAFQQPFPQDIYEVAFATLYDPKGGILVQPAFQWTLSSHWRTTLFYNYVNGHLNGNPNNNLFGTSSEYANEVSVRIQYQF